ncbi:MAG: hypothetical protein IPK35_13105 [Saprospiraceae bacterium]|jgi:hypothetical protein|nr:hypothetical protein [Saprospiraceae bacterium]
MEKNSLLMGLVLGCITPVLGFVVVEFLFEQMTVWGIMDEVTSSSASKRFRTTALIAICTVLIPFNVAVSKKWDQTVRGMVFPTLIYAGAWMYKFYMELIN